MIKNASDVEKQHSVCLVCSLSYTSPHDHYCPGICYASAAHCDAADDTKLLLHHTEPAGARHAAVPRLHPTVLALSHAQPPTRKSRVTPQPARPSQQPPRPLVRHAVVLHLVQRTDATAAAAKVSQRAACAGKPDVLEI